MKGYPTGFKPLLLGSLILLILLVLTGLLLTPTTLDFRLEWNVPWRLSGDGRVVTVAVHVGLSYLLLAFIGALWPAHIRAGLKKGKNRSSGALMLTFLVSLPVSGLGVLYLGDQDWADVTALAHLTVGLLVMLVTLWHLTHKKRRQLGIRRLANLGPSIN